MNPVTTERAALSPPRLPTSLQPGDPCPCCGGALIEAASLAEILGVTPRRVYGWMTKGSSNKLPAHRSEPSSMPLWCAAAALVFKQEGVDLMNGRKPAKWSKKASTEIRDEANRKVAWEDSHLIRLHWRVNDVQTTATFQGPGHRLKAQQLKDQIERAHVEGWAHNDQKWPIPPLELQTAPSGTTTESPRAEPAGACAEAAPAPLNDRRRTIAAAIDVLRTQILNSDMKEKQQNDSESALAFIGRFLVYPENHPQLETLGIPAGSSFLLDDEHGLSPSDLAWFVQVRRTTNMRVWNTYVNKHARWERDCRVATRKAARQHVEAVLPDRPQPPTDMKVAGRTEEYTWQLLAQVLNVALESRWITFNPYTASVANQVGVSPATARLTPRDVFTQSEVQELVDFIGSMTKTMKNPYTGLYETVSGAKFALFVELRGRIALRNEEGVALFDDDFFDLDTQRAVCAPCWRRTEPAR